MNILDLLTSISIIYTFQICLGYILYVYPKQTYNFLSSPLLKSELRVVQKWLSKKRKKKNERKKRRTEGNHFKHITELEKKIPIVNNDRRSRNVFF